MIVEIKHKKLCDKLPTDTSFYVTICTRRRPCESKKLHSKLKSRDVVRWFDCTCGNLCDKHGVIC